MPVRVAASSFIMNGASRPIFPAARFHAPMLFSWQGRSTTGEVPPAGSEGGAGDGDGNGGGGRRIDRPISAIEVLRADVRRIKDVSLIIERVEQDIEAEGKEGVASQLNYIRDASFLLEGKGSSLGPQVVIAIAHRISQILDRLTRYITPAGFAESVPSDVANAAKPLFRIAVDFEKKLLERNMLTPELKRKIADIHSVFGRKGQYYYALQDESEAESLLGASLALLILFDTVKRYEILKTRADAAEAIAFMEELGRVRGIEGDLRAWAFSQIAGMQHRSISAMGPFREEADIIESIAGILSTGWNDMTRGIYLFSPHIYAQAATELSTSGFPELSAHYLTRASYEEGLARRLDLYEDKPVL